MTALNTYSTGTVAVNNGDTVVVGTGTIWSGVNARPGDLIIVDDLPAVEIKDVTDTAHLALWSPWSGGDKSSVAYTIIQKSPLRFAGGDVMAQVNQMVAALNTNGIPIIVPPTETGPDPSLGEEDQYAIQPGAYKFWLKTGGVWVFQGVYKGFQVKGPWGSGTAYAIGDVASLSGSSYVATAPNTNQSPPNATYWAVLASKGDTGPTQLKPIAPWATATNYVVGPPADFVSQGGSSYQCLVAHTSGTFATDLAAGKWGLVSQAGTNGINGAGYGGTSTTSLTIATGSQAFTTQAGLAYQNGARVRATATSDTTKWMEGVATYSGTTLTITVDKTNGSGTFASWNFNVVGQPGAGDLSSANNLSDLANKPQALLNLGIPAIMRSYLSGLTLSTAGASTIFSVAAGVAVNSTNVDTLILAASLNKDVSAWAVGASGSLDTGTIANSTWYHVHLIKRTDTGVVDVLVSLSATAPTLPTNYTLFRRIGSMKTNGSAQWTKFIQNGDEFKWDSPTLDVNAVSAGTAAVLRTIPVPLGVVTEAMINVRVESGSSGEAVYISDPAVSDLSPSSSAPLATFGTSVSANVVTSVRCRTNTSAQIRTRQAVGGATETLKIAVTGWVDRRGRDD